VAIARNYVASAGLDLVCSPTFADISIDGQDRTGIHLLVESRNRADLPAGAKGDEVRLRVTASSFSVPLDGSGDGKGPHHDDAVRGESGAGSPRADGVPPPILRD